MLDSCPSEIRRHLWKSQVKIKPCLVLFSGMYQMFCSIETFFRFRDCFQFIPCLGIDLNQTADRRTINIPVSGGSGYSVFAVLHHNWILSSSFFLFLTNIKNEFFQITVFLFALRYKNIPVPCSCHSPLLHNKMDSTDALPKVPSSVLDEQEISVWQCSPS